MNTPRALTLALLTTFAGCAQLVHVPPGTSVELALARKPEVIRVPHANPPPPQLGQPSQPGSQPPKTRIVSIPAVEPTLPTNDSVTAAAEAYTRGRLALDDSRTDDAIKAFQQAVQMDPQFTDGWQGLAMAYEKAGKGDKAKEAFRHSKDLALQ